MDGPVEDASATVAVPDALLELLVCPVDHTTLRRDGRALRCETCHRRFPIEDGIPTLLIEDER